MNMLTTIVKDDHTFDAILAPLYGIDGKPISPMVGRAVVRNDSQETIAIAGPKFKPVQHREIVSPIIQHFEANGYALEQRSKTQNSLYDLKGKKGAFVSSQFSENGAVMRTDIITGDFINPTGSSHYLDQGDDTMLFKVSVFNSHNGSLAVRVVTSYERLICLNGMTRPDFSAGVYGKHTSGFNIKAMEAKIANSLGGMEHDAERFGQWASTSLGVQGAEKMLQATVAKLPNKANGTAHFSEPLVNKILEQYRREDQTVWGLFQAVTHWQSHGNMKEGSNPINTRISRENQVASMLRSNAWGELVAA